MAITFLKKRRRQKYLIYILALIIFIISILVWYAFIRKEKLTAFPLFIKSPEVKINWDVLKDPRMEELQLFEEIELLETQIGREDPFLPYEQPESQ